LRLQLSLAAIACNNMQRRQPPMPLSASTARGTGAVVLAALALPGVWVAPARAELAPDQGLIAFKLLHYEDSQPGLKRVSVDSPSIYLLAPLTSQWALEGSLVVDSLSGATPRWQSAVSSASVMSDERKAGDVKVTRYFERSSYSVGLAHSTEHDYVSTALSLGGSWSSDDNNTTWNAGVAGTYDKINPTNGGQALVSNQRKKTAELIVGVTQALSSTDLVQLNLSHSLGRGYFSDPYKNFDERPRERSQTALLARWNHYLESDRSTLRGSYRYYNDSFGINAHTLQVEWVKPLGGALTLTPLLRLYSQSAASFYAKAVTDTFGLPIYPTLLPGQLNSGDQRLSAFGAITLGLKGEYRLDNAWTVDAKFETYQQRSNWRIGGAGSTGLDPFRATFVQFGASRKF
jgi:Protein of unknown function (DUF3570)